MGSCDGYSGGPGRSAYPAAGFGLVFRKIVFPQRPARRDGRGDGRNHPRHRIPLSVRGPGEQHALAGSCAVERLERAIPEPQRPFDHADNRQALIRHWWPLERQSA